MKCGRSCYLLPVKALLNLAFNLTNSAKKSLILSQREQNEGKALATPKSGPPKKGVPRMGDAGRGAWGEERRGWPKPTHFLWKKRACGLHPISLPQICAWPQARSRRIPALTGGGISGIKNYLIYISFSYFLKTSLYLGISSNK